MGRLLVVALIALASLRLTAAQPGPPGPLGPPNPAVAVPRHLSHVAEHLAGAQATNDVGRRALAEARVSLNAAQAALDAKALRTADELAASADDLIHAATGPLPHAGRAPKPEPDPEEVLARIDVITSALADVTNHRVRDLLAFANTVANQARQKAALGQSDAGRDAATAEAIARAAAHVAIAVDPSLAPVLPPPHAHKHPHELLQSRR